MPSLPEQAVRLVRERSRSRPRPTLDPVQRLAVEHRGGPLLVLGGPGTGKTMTLAEAIVHRVEHAAVPPDRILALTFGRRAAADLRSQISSRLRRTLRAPMARTFHSYAFGLLRREAVLAGEPAPRLLSGAEQDLLIRDLLRGEVDELGTDHWPSTLRPALLTRGFAQELRDLLQRAAERGVTPEELTILGRRHHRPDWVAAARFARQYFSVTALRQPPVYDPAELVRAAIEALRGDPDLLRRERAAYRFVAVDEYQEADPAQEELLQLVAGGGRELLVTGDIDQSIFAFRGADTDVIRRFPDRFPTVSGRSATVVTLPLSWRASGPLLAATRRVAQRLGGPAAHRDLRPGFGVHPGGVEVHLLRSSDQEARFIAQRLREAHLVGETPWSRMAVLVRSSAELPPLRRALHYAGVPIAMRVEDQALVRLAAVQPLLRLFELATGRRELDSELAVQLVTSPLGGADQLALRRLRQELRRFELASGGGRSSAALLIEAIDRKVELAPLDERTVGPASRVADVLAAARDAAARSDATAEDVLWSIWSRSGLGPTWSRQALAGGAVGRAADRDLDAVVALFDMAARFVDRLPKAGPEVFLDHLLGQEVPADTLSSRAPAGESVTLLTAHAAKGLEWDVVVAAGMQEGSWPNLRMRGSLLGSQLLVDLVGLHETSAAVAMSQVLAEERRLFYVAATRARRLLLVTAVSSDEAQPSRFVDEIVPTPVSPEPLATERQPTDLPRGLDLASVVAELRSVVCAPVDAVAPARRRGAAAELARLAKAGVRGADPADWYGLAGWSDDGPLRDPAESVRVSPSKVEAFGRCELRWLLESNGGTAGESAIQGIGTLVHDLAYEAARGDTEPAKLLERLDQRWGELDTGSGWWAQRQRDQATDMVRRLAAWLTTRSHRAFVAAEADFDVQVGRARLVGRVDRLERDAQGRLVVVDYKTGRSKPAKAEIVEHRQLAAYQLAVDQGGFDDVAPGERRSGGARLVQLGSGSAATEQVQPPLADAADPAWAAAMVRETAERMAGAAFRAIENRWCATCPVRRACPLFDEGRQVTP